MATGRTFGTSLSPPLSLSLTATKGRKKETVNEISIHRAKKMIDPIYANYAAVRRADGAVLFCGAKEDEQHVIVTPLMLAAFATPSLTQTVKVSCSDIRSVRIEDRVEDNGRCKKRKLIIDLEPFLQEDGVCRRAPPGDGCCMLSLTAVAADYSYNSPSDGIDEHVFMKTLQEYVKDARLAHGRSVSADFITAQVHIPVSGDAVQQQPVSGPCDRLSDDLDRRRQLAADYCASLAQDRALTIMSLKREVSAKALLGPATCAAALATTTDEPLRAVILFPGEEEKRAVAAPELTGEAAFRAMVAAELGQSNEPWKSDWNREIIRRLAANDPSIEELWISGLQEDAPASPLQSHITQHFGSLSYRTRLSQYKKKKTPSSAADEVVSLISVTAFTDLQPIIAALSRNNQISSIVFENCSTVTDAFIESLAALELSKEPRLAGIAHLMFISCTQLSDASCRTLRRWISADGSALSRVTVRGESCPFSRAEYDELQRTSTSKIIANAVK